MVTLAFNVNVFIPGAAEVTTAALVKSTLNRLAYSARLPTLCTASGVKLPLPWQDLH